jgi:hypothetical protein
MSYWKPHRQDHGAASLREVELQREQEVHVLVRQHGPPQIQHDRALVACVVGTERRADLEVGHEAAAVDDLTIDIFISSLDLRFTIRCVFAPEVPPGPKRITRNEKKAGAESERNFLPRGGTLQRCAGRAPYHNAP